MMRNLAILIMYEAKWQMTLKQTRWPVTREWAMGCVPWIMDCHDSLGRK